MDYSPSRWVAPRIGNFLSAALLLSLLLTACGPAPRRADLVVGVEQEPSTLDPRLGSDVAADRASRLLYRGLFTTGKDFAAEPDLVQSWRMRDATHYLFRLRKGVRFWTGREVTARDAAFTLDSIRSPKVPSFRKGDLAKIAAVTAEGPYALAVTLAEPYAPLPSALTVGILPEGSALNPDPPVGCGPYRLKRWVHGQWMVFERNPFASPAPLSPTLAFKIIPDPVVRSLEMRRGSVDLVVNDLPPDSLAYFQRRGYPFHRSPGANYAYIGFNCRKPPLDQVSVRQAVAFAVNRRAILANVLDGYGRLATGLLPPGHWAYNRGVTFYPFDISRALALLDKAGLRPGADGVRLRLTYKTSDNKVSRRVASALAENLREVGIDLRVQWLEWGTFYGDVKRGNFDLYGLTWVGVTDPDGFRLRFASSAVPPGGFNRGRYSNPEVDRLLEEGARAADARLRKRVYGRVQEILAREVPYVSLWYPDNVCVTQRGVQGVTLPLDGNFSFLTRVRRAGLRKHGPG